MISAGRAGRTRSWLPFIFGCSRVAGAVIIAGACSLASVGSAPAVAVARFPPSDISVATSLLAAPVDIVIAVDESSSIKPAEMMQEQDAARLIAFGEFAPESKIAVLGFGGRNKQYNAKTNREPPVNYVCPMTEIDTLASRQSLSACIGHLATRTPAQGDHTDFIAAITDSVSDLVGAGDTGRPLLLFLLTDGRLDMVDAPGYAGLTKSEVYAKANQVLRSSTLPRARTRGVRIWPLGFGSDVNLGELQQIAAGGAQGSCSSALPEATPRAITVQSSSQIESVLQQIFANARCLGYTPGTSASIRSGGSVNLYVSVPAVVTSGTIEVVRQYQQVSVTYFDPDNRPLRGQKGSLAGQAFSLVGANGPVESLSVDSPIPGRWRVHVAAPRGLPRNATVTASVLWRGVLHADIVTAPADPAPGQAVTATAKLQVASRPLSARNLADADVHISVRVSGPGLTAPITVPLNDDGIPPGPIAHNGIYNGRFTLPRSARGVLSVSGIVVAPGVTGDASSTSITVDSSGLLITGQMALSSGEVAQGGRVVGTLQLSNPVGQPHTIRLVPVDTPPGVTVSPSTISLPGTAGRTSYQFTLHVADSVPLGAVTGHINARDAVTGAVYAQAEISNDVIIGPKTHPSGWLWVFTGLIAGLVALALLLLLLLHHLD
jgi:hypothetical protein